MADMQGDAERFFAQIEGMSGAQLAERGRIARMQQRWTETPWYRREHGLEQLAIATAEIFGLLHDSNARVEAVRDAAQDMVRDADASARPRPARGAELALAGRRRARGADLIALRRAFW